VPILSPQGTVPAAQPTDNTTYSSTTNDEGSQNTNKNNKTKTKKMNKQNSSSSSAMELENELRKAKEQIQKEKTVKRKLYSSLVKLANELKKAKRKRDDDDYASQAWYQGGMWRAPQVLPSLPGEKSQNRMSFASAASMAGGSSAALGGGGPPQTAASILNSRRAPISLSDLFFDLIIVTAFTRVGTAVSEHATVDGPVLAYFAVFWTIWSKEASYSTRFDTSDLSSQMETLITCFAVLFGSLSCSSDVNDDGEGTAAFSSEDSTRIMMVAGFVAILHLALHVRVVYWYRHTLATRRGSVEEHVRQYAMYNLIMNVCEITSWAVGIFVLPQESQYRWVVFLCGILFALRVPRAFLANDFHGACSKRAVLFILLLGFVLQNIVLEASPFFDYQEPNLEQYAFLGLSCLLLFCIKLLYVDDFGNNMRESDHALLVNRWAGFFFHLGQFALLLSTTVLGAGLNQLTHSYLAATAALPNNAKNLTCGGFAAVIAAIAFIKSMHVRRVPRDPKQRWMFILAYSIQVAVMIAVVYLSINMCLASSAETSMLAALMVNEISMLCVLAGFALCLVVTQWLDEAVELTLYDNTGDQFLVQPFGIWGGCLRPEVTLEEAESISMSIRPSSDRRLSALSPLLGSSVANMKLSQFDLNSYNDDSGFNAV